MDSGGNFKIITPPPIKDTLTVVIQKIIERSEEIWLIAGLILANVVTKLFLCLLISVSRYTLYSCCELIQLHILSVDFC